MIELFAVSYVLLWLLVLLQGLLIVGLIRNYYSRHESTLEPGGSASRIRKVPGFKAFDVEGRNVRDSDFKGRSYGVLVVMPGSPASNAAIQNLGPLTGRVGNSVMVVCEGTTSACAELALATPPWVKTVVDADGSVSRAFGVADLPATYVVDEEGWIRLEGGIVDKTKSEPSPLDVQVEVSPAT